MPFWLVIAGAFAGFVWWASGADSTRTNPTATQKATRTAGASAGLFGLMLLMRLGPWRAWAMLSSVMAAMPALARILQWHQENLGNPNHRNTHASRNQPLLSREEAAQLLDISTHATREEVETAYRKVMARVHPDTGGNAYLAQLVNQARDRLLG